jgi:DNA-binding NarL/FixJ family response regulator
MTGSATTQARTHEVTGPDQRTAARKEQVNPCRRILDDHGKKCAAHSVIAGNPRAVGRRGTVSYYGRRMSDKYSICSMTDPKRLRLLIVDDHEMVRMALKHVLAPLAGEVVFDEAATAERALEIAAQQPDLDLILIDLEMPGIGGLQGVRALRTAHPELPLIVCSATEDPARVAQLLALTVAGFIPKSEAMQVIQQAVRLVLAGGTYVPSRLMLQGAASPPPPPPQEVLPLTGRQIDVMRLLSHGKPNKLIARELDISESTVKVHLLAIFRALGVHNRTEAVIAAAALLQRHESPRRALSGE